MATNDVGQNHEANHVRDGNPPTTSNVTSNGPAHENQSNAGKPAVLIIGGLGELIFVLETYSNCIQVHERKQMLYR